MGVLSGCARLAWTEAGPLPRRPGATDCRARGRRPAARNRVPERVGGFKWNLRGTGDPSRRSGLPVRRARRDLSPVRLLDL